MPTRRGVRCTREVRGHDRQSTRAGDAAPPHERLARQWRRTDGVACAISRQCRRRTTASAVRSRNTRYVAPSLQRHVPFVAIPRARRPTTARRAPRSGAGLDASAAQAAPIGRHAHRPAVARPVRVPAPENGSDAARQSAAEPVRHRAVREHAGAALLRPRMLGIRARTAPSRTRRAARSRRAAGEPQRPSPISAVSRAISVDSCSGDGSGRVSSENWTTRPGVGSTATTTRSMAAAGRMRFEIEQRQRAQRPRVAHRRRQLQRPLVHARASTRCRRTCSTAAPRSRRSRCADSGSSSRPSTNDSGSSPSIGHSRSSACSKRSSGTAGTSGRASSPRASRCHSTPALPEPRRHVVRRQRRQVAQRAQAPAAESARSSRPARMGRMGRAGRDVRTRRRVRAIVAAGVAAVATMAASRASGSGATAVASLPGSTTVRPARWRTSSRAAVRVRGDGDADAQAAVGGRAAHLLGDRARLAEQPRQTAQIEHDLARAAHLDARRELARDGREDVGGHSPSAAYNTPNTTSLRR